MMLRVNFTNLLKVVSRIEYAKGFSLYLFTKLSFLFSTMIPMRMTMNRRDANVAWRLNVPQMAAWTWMMRMLVRWCLEKKRFCLCLHLAGIQPCKEKIIVEIFKFEDNDNQCHLLCRWHARVHWELGRHQRSHSPRARQHGRTSYRNLQQIQELFEDLRRCSWSQPLPRTNSSNVRRKQVQFRGRLQHPGLWG